MEKLLLLFAATRSASGDLLASGQLSAIDGALKAASLGGSIVGLCGADFVCLAAMPSLSVDELSAAEKLAYAPERLWHVSRATAVAAVGFARDVGLVEDFVRNECAAHVATFGSDPPASRLADELTDAVAAAARQSHPIGVHVLVAGVGPRGPLLCHVDPSGRELRTTGSVAVGSNADKLRDALRTQLEAKDDDGVLELNAAKQVLKDTILAVYEDRFDESSSGRPRRGLRRSDKRPPPSAEFAAMTLADYRTTSRSIGRPWVMSHKEPLFPTSAAETSPSEVSTTTQEGETVPPAEDSR